MKELLEAVRTMRWCQEEHKRTKNYHSLHNQNEAENRVDKLLKDLEHQGKEDGK